MAVLPCLHRLLSTVAKLAVLTRADLGQKVQSANVQAHVAR
jgi:hypothetical protein